MYVCISNLLVLGVLLTLKRELGWKERKIVYFKWTSSSSLYNSQIVLFGTNMFYYICLEREREQKSLT